MGQAALHHVEAVAGAGSYGREPLAGRAARHPRQRLHALVLRRDLQDLRHDLLALGERLGEGPGGHEAATELQGQLLRDVAEGLQVLHVLAHTLKVAEKIGRLGFILYKDY